MKSVGRELCSYFNHIYTVISSLPAKVTVVHYFVGFFHVMVRFPDPPCSPVMKTNSSVKVFLLPSAKNLRLMPELKKKKKKARKIVLFAG